MGLFLGRSKFQAFVLDLGCYLFLYSFCFCNHDWFWNTKVLSCLVENIFMDLLFWDLKQGCCFRY